jgi:hypothetical protein
MVIVIGMICVTAILELKTRLRSSVLSYRAQYLVGNPRPNRLGRSEGAIPQIVGVPSLRLASGGQARMPFAEEAAKLVINARRAAGIGQPLPSSLQHPKAQARDGHQFECIDQRTYVGRWLARLST